VSTAFPEANRQYSHLVRDIRRLQDQQRQAHVQVVPEAELQELLGQIQSDLKGGDLQHAQAGMRTLRASLAGWQHDIANRPTTPAPGVVVAATNPQAPTTGGIALPILLYHDTPPNFDQQLTHLEQAGYTVIDLDQALAGMHGGPLPAKPVVITFDDGFSTQLRAFDILKRHNMKATFYIVNGGASSRWCIGAGRRYNDPLQPPSGCGDAYLNWNEIRMLDQSGLITIGGHTLDHENLTTLPLGEQRRQIADSKAGIEHELGHNIRHFAYPYGAYNQTSIEMAREAGYVTAVTVAPGTHQAAGTDFTLKRVRDTLTLP